MTDPIEALADAIQHVEGWGPESRSYINRNPGNLYGGRGRERCDAEGYKVFDSYIVGYVTLKTVLLDLLTGHNRLGVSGESQLQELCAALGHAYDPSRGRNYATAVARWLTRALQMEITATTKIGDIWHPAHVPEVGETQAAVIAHV